MTHEPCQEVLANKEDIKVLRTDVRDLKEAHYVDRARQEEQLVLLTSNVNDIVSRIDRVSTATERLLVILDTSKAGVALLFFVAKVSVSISAVLGLMYWFSKNTTN